MEDPEKRALHTFLFLSASAAFMEGMMRYNGATSPYYTAYGLIHPIVLFFFWSWILILAIGAIFATLSLIHRLQYQRDEKMRKAIAETNQLQERRRRTAEQRRESKLKAQNELDRQKKMEEDKIERLRIEKERLEIRSQRSPADAISAAFAEFLKGG
jgi:hypothetical protein